MVKQPCVITNLYLGNFCHVYHARNAGTLLIYWRNSVSIWICESQHPLPWRSGGDLRLKAQSETERPKAQKCITVIACNMIQISVDTPLICCNLCLCNVIFARGSERVLHVEHHFCMVCKLYTLLYFPVKITEFIWNSSGFKNCRCCAEFCTPVRLCTLTTHTLKF